MKFSYKVIIGCVAVIVLIFFYNLVSDWREESAKKEQAEKMRNERNQQNAIAREQLMPFIAPRETRMNAWLAAGDMVAGKTAFPEARTIMGFAHKNARLGMPHEKGTRYLSVPDSSTYALGFVPILPDEKMPNEDWQRTVSQVNAGAWCKYDNESTIYGQPVRSATVVAMNSDSLGPVAQGILMIHEEGHGMNYLLGLFDFRDTVQNFREEIRAHTLQNAMLLNLGGAGYRTIVDTYKARISESMDRDHATLEKRIPMPPPYDPALGSIFTPMKESEFEKALYRSFVYVNAVFEMIDERYTGPKQERVKLDFMASFYRTLAIH